MKVLYDLPRREQEALALQKGEQIWYCVPYDIGGTQRTQEGYAAVTERRLVILLRGEKIQEFDLAETEKVRCEAAAGCGILTVWMNGTAYFAAKCSMEHIERLSCAAKGAEALAHGEKIRVESPEPERRCPKCGRAMAGSSLCVKCDGKYGTLKRFLELCKGSGMLLAAISAIMLLSALVGLIIPRLESGFIDNYLKPKAGGARELMLFSGTMLFMSVVTVLTFIARNWWCAKLAAGISMHLRECLYEKIQHLSMSSINRRKPGELLNRISQDTREVSRFVNEIFGQLFSVVFVLLLTLTVMIAMNPFLTMVSVSFTLAAVVLNRIFWRYIHRIYEKYWKRYDEMESGLEDTISGIRVVKTFGREQAEIEKFRAVNEEFRVIHTKNECFWSVFYPMLTFCMSIGTYLVIYFGGRAVLLNTMTMGELVQFTSYAGALYGPISWMSHLPRGVMQMLTCVNRIFDVLDEEPRIREAENPVEFEIQGEIEFEDVSFGYRSYEPILEHVNLSVKKGEMIGLVGPSGAGKSTMINLIMRLYDPDSGRITVDGTDIKNIRQETLHGQIGVVLQETFLFSGSILDNIRFAKQDASIEEIIRAAKAANAHDFITKLPDGYQTWVGENGFTLSGGERQRIAIARAVLTDPKLLILDEATSALDTESEYLIQQALSRLTKGRTTFAIAHRLSTLREADRLVVIDRHGIAECGTHNELLEKKGIYYGLVKAQLEMAKNAEETC